MKVVWEGSDIKTGRRVKMRGGDEMWMIGYDPDPGFGDERKYVLVSLLDGTIAKPLQNKVGLAAALTAGDYLPEELLPSS